MTEGKDRRPGGGDSDPLDEQEFIAGLVNRLERQRSCDSTAMVVMYDDSDGAYDHVMPPIVNDSHTAFDALSGPLTGMFSFGHRRPPTPRVFLDPETGEVR